MTAADAIASFFGRDPLFQRQLASGFPLNLLHRTLLAFTPIAHCLLHKQNLVRWSRIWNSECSVREAVNANAFRDKNVICIFVAFPPKTKN